MTFEFRSATEADMDQFGLLTAYAYAGAFGDGPDNIARQSNRPEWILCAFDGATLAASYGTIPFTMRANGNPMPMGGVTTVATAPEYRRRGLLRAITSRALAAQREAGQPVAALWASQAAIYQRYGYATASVMGQYSIDTADIALLRPPPDGVAVERTTVREGFDTLKQIYRAFVAERTLYLHRASVTWQTNILADDEATGPAHVAICHDAAGDAVGYLVYTMRSNRNDHRARSQDLVIRDLAWLTMDACTALWSFIARHDLVGRVSWDKAPLDDPLPELIAEPRMLHTQPGEGVWLRVVDVAPALAGRGYNVDGEVTIGVAAEPLTPWNEGTYRLTVSGGAAQVDKVSAAAEVTLDIKALASAFSGFRRLRDLANWGLAEGSDAAINRADALLATRFAPHSPDHF